MIRCNVRELYCWHQLFDFEHVVTLIIKAVVRQTCVLLDQLSANSAKLCHLLGSKFTHVSFWQTVGADGHGNFW